MFYMIFKRNTNSKLCLNFTKMSHIACFVFILFTNVFSYFKQRRRFLSVQFARQSLTRFLL